MSVLLRRATLSVLALSACLLLFAAACADSDGAGPTDRPTDGASVTPGPPTDAPTPAPTPRPSAPADWPTYTDADGRYSLRYTPDWYSSERGGFYSYDVNSDTGSPGSIRPNAVKVEAHVFDTTDRRYCGAALRLDASGALDSIDAEATATTLGGQPAWEVIQDDPDPPATRIHGISLLHEGYCIHLIAYYTQETPDEQTLAQIADSFEFHF